MIATISSLLVAASSPPTPVDNDIDSESAKSGPIGLALIVILCVVCYFLFKSMSKHLRSVRENSMPSPTTPVARPRPQFDVAVPLDPRVREEPAPNAPPPPPA